MSRYVRLVKAVLIACERACIPLYSSRYSRRDYTQHQHTVLLVLKGRLRKDYREFTEDFLPVSRPILDVLGLDKIPHFTTLNKFLLRIRGSLLERILLSFLSLIPISRLMIGIDSTGMKLGRASHHYIETVKGKLRVRKHMKLTFTTELRSQMMCSLLVRRERRSDQKDLKPCLRKLGKKKVEAVIGDKGFDSELNHRFIREEMKAVSIIKPRNLEVPVHRTKGMYRKLMKKLWNSLKKEYGKRNICETALSVLKRKLGEEITSRRVKAQNNEQRIKAIAYNAHRAVVLGILELVVKVFYRASKTIILYITI
ncbi:hypothetical protein HRbin06_00483 [archaeon HR06]|nr:hypothetical protein HRbin06_00483 [archaeon HR06]